MPTILQSVVQEPYTCRGCDCLLQPFCPFTTMYLSSHAPSPKFSNNEARRSGGALYASHPEALSLVCEGSNNNSSSPPLNRPIDYAAGFDEAYLGARVLEAMQKGTRSKEVSQQGGRV